MITSGNLISVQFVSCQAISSSLNHFHKMRMRFPKLFRKSFPLRVLLSRLGWGASVLQIRSCWARQPAPCPILLGLVLREAIPSWKKPVLGAPSVSTCKLQVVSSWKSYIPCSGSRHLGSPFAFQVSAWHNPTVFFSSRLKKPRWVQALPPPKTFPPLHAYGQD